MKALLIKYLWVTGLGGAVVIAFPALVVIGLIGGILPGLVLGALPTAFLYGVLFAAIWFPLHGAIGDWPAVIVAMAATLAGMYALPIPGNRITEARYRAELAGDVLPPAPIALAGHIRLVSSTMTNQKDIAAVRAEQRRTAGKTDAYAAERQDRLCGALCTALLFTKGAASVTVSRDNAGAPRELAPEAATFRLVDRGACATTLTPEGAYDDWVGGAADLLAKLKDYWGLRLSTDRCIVREPARRDHDWLILSSLLVTPLPADRSTPGQRPLLPRTVEVRRLEIFDARNRLVLRQSRARAIRIGQPLSYLPGGGMENFGFRWGSAPFEPPGDTGVPVVQLLADHAGLDLGFDSTAATAGIRQRLAAVVAAPATGIDKATVDLVPAFFKSLDKAAATPADITLGLALIADRRFTNFGNAYDFKAALQGDSARLRAPIVDRLLAAEFGGGFPADARLRQSLQPLGSLLGDLPRGTFADLAPHEAALLADPLRRTLAPGLIRRQADRGAAAAPLLAAIIAEQLALQAASKRGSSDIDHAAAYKAAIAGLTRIGPAARGVLPTLEDLAARGGVFKGLAEGDDWWLMLIRLGKPIDSIVEPERPSVITHDFHGRLRWMRDRYERDLASEA